PRPEHKSDRPEEGDRRVPEGEPRSHRERTPTILEQLPRRIVDGHDMIRIHAVPQAELVGDEPESCEDGGYLADVESQDETDGGSAKDQRINNPDPDPLAPGYAEPGGVGVVWGGSGSSMTHVSEVTLVAH